LSALPLPTLTLLPYTTLFRSFDKYAAIARHIVMHYNRGWAKGFHYHIRYWEIWNEPDLGKVFWAGTAQQYYELYAKLARAVKSADRKSTRLNSSHLVISYAVF